MRLHASGELTIGTATSPFSSKLLLYRNNGSHTSQYLHSDGNGGDYSFIVLYRSRAGGQALANDYLGSILFDYKDSAGNPDEAGGDISCQLLDPTSGSEDAQFLFSTVVGGAYANRVKIYAGMQIGTPTGG
jgi:hypothetical protein